MAIKQKVKRGFVKVHRKVFGKSNEIMISTGKGGLTKSEINDVLSTLGKACKQGKVPDLTYEYRPPVRILSSRDREPVWLIPKNVSVAAARVKIRAVMRAKYGAKYLVV